MSQRETIAEQLFGEALELPREERRAFLERACGDEPGLRRAVEDRGVGDQIGFHRNFLR